MPGTVVSINRSHGGVPKLPVAEARVTEAGLDGDRHRDLRFHGGPIRAVCLYSLEVIQALQHEGHPIAPGTIARTSRCLDSTGRSWSPTSSSRWVKHTCCSRSS